MADITKTSIKLVADIQDVDQKLAQVSRKLGEVGAAGADSAEKLNRSYSSAAKGVRSISEQLEAVQSTFNKGLAAGVFVASISRVVSGLIEAQQASEKLKNSLSYSFDAAGVAKEMEYLRNITRSLGVDYQAAATGYAKFGAAVKGSGITLEQQRTIFEGVAQATAKFGLSAADAEGVFLALSQMASKGTVSAEEMRGQLAERLPGAMRIAAQSMGVTEREFGKLLATGQVIASDFLPKFGQALKDGITAPMSSLTQEINRLNGAWDIWKQTLANSDGGGFQWLTNGLNESAAAMRELGREAGITRKLLVAIGGFEAGMIGAGKFDTQKVQQQAMDRLAIVSQGRRSMESKNLNYLEQGQLRQLVIEEQQLRDQLLSLAQRRGKETFQLPDLAGEFKAQTDKRKQAFSDYMAEVTSEKDKESAQEVQRFSALTTIIGTSGKDYEVALAAHRQKLAEIKKKGAGADTSKNDAAQAFAAELKGVQDYSNSAVNIIKEKVKQQVVSERDGIEQMLATQNEGYVKQAAMLKDRLAKTSDAGDRAKMQAQIAALGNDAAEAAERAATSLAKLDEEALKVHQHYMKGIGDETSSLIEKAKAAEEELKTIGLSTDQLAELTRKRYDEQIAIKQAAADQIRGIDGREAELFLIEQQIDALRRLQSAEIAKPRLQEQAREWEKFADDINRALTDALMRGFESGKSFGQNFVDSLKNSLKTAALRIVINTVTSTGGSLLNGAINYIAGTGGSNNGAGANYLGLANNANSVYNLGSAAVNTYGALTTGAGAISGTATLANIYGAAGGDSLGAFIAMNPQWTSAASSAGAAAGAEAGAAAGSASASASSAASYAGYAAALYQAYKGDYASASLTATGTYIGSMFGPWGAAIGALVGTLVGSFIQPGGGPKDNNRYSYSGGNYERLSGGSAGVLKDYSASAADQINGLAAMYGNDTRIAGREAWLSLDPRGTASTQLNLELFDQIGRKLYSRMDEYGGNIENVGRSSASLQENMARTMRDAVLLAVARADIGDAVTVALFDQFESGIKSLSATQGDMVIGALKMGWLDDVLGVVDEAKIGLAGVADAVANLFSIIPMKKVFDDLGVSIFDIGAQTEQTLPALANLKKTITGADGAQVTETFRETYLRTVSEFIAVGNMLDAMGIKVTDAFKMSDVNTVLSMSDALVQLFGSIDAMSQSFNAYYENFYSSAEKSARSWELMQRSFDGLGVAMPATREGFRQLVDALDLSTESGRATFNSLMNLQAGFAALTPTLDDVAAAAASVAAASQARIAVNQEAQAQQIGKYVAAQRAAQASIISDNITAAQASADSALSIANTFRSILDSLDQYRQRLLTGDTSTLSPADKYTEAKRSYETTAAQARLGDKDAAGKLQSVADSFLAASKEANGYSTYSIDFGSVVGTLDAVIGTADRNVSIYDQQLQVARAQLTSLESIRAALENAGTGGSNNLPLVVNDYQKAADDWALYFAQTTIGQIETYAIGTVQRLSESMAMFTDKFGSSYTFSASDSPYSLAEQSSVWADEMRRRYGQWTGPSFDIGTNFVPADMLAMVHHGERIIPAADNANLINNAVTLLDEIKALRTEVTLLRAETKATASHTSSMDGKLARLMPDGDALAVRAAA